MDNAIQLNNVTYFYHYHSSFSVEALSNINLNISNHSFTAIIGHTGSGKSTLIQHFNALLKPNVGSVNIYDQRITSNTKEKYLTNIRKNVGLIFQFPEHQLFEDTVKKDIEFGPRNFDMSQKQADKVVKKSLDMVKLPLNFLSKSPFELSGGQKRKVAIAGILALHPQILVLDEPTVGLDPVSQTQIMDMINELHKKYGITIILVTHQMNIVAKYADEVIVMNSGKIIKHTTPRILFNNQKFLKKMQLGVPTTIDFVNKLQSRGMFLNKVPLTEKELAKELSLKFKMRDSNE